MSTLPRHRRTTAVAALTAALLVSLAACGGNDSKDSGSNGGTKAASGGTTKLTVLAASSLTDVLPKAAETYEKQHPNTKIIFSFAGSQALAAQVRQGAPADGILTADTKTMDGLKSQTGKQTIVAKNRLVIATGKGNPKKVSALKDLTSSKLKVVLAAPAVPVGNYSREVLDAQHLTVKPVSEEPNVRAVLSKVELGEADAGIVYKTDAATAPDKVDTVKIPDDQNRIASYPAATLKDSHHAAATAAFIQWLTTPQAQKILTAAGFQSP
ncbi:molybdate ABC transporter substrate-binding protein [Streptomyces beihaiensis]|uniref:Molybdate ABC transporter substrate-binding protein n=1 Tax=Streptomyces beihaiensis TaxID=2984495 RepID=A0ABT3TYV2_9ACTN|nr:molybdate ABC transporter substrate-binding protein [Streptomyces beihaiensis]MCX3061965.1 molybdate ABC transporter substrate-binding protein [Streptomyces beihaiensis]